MSDAHQFSVHLPRIGCDFNAFGLGEQSGNVSYYYSFNRTQVELLHSLVGRRVVLFSHDTETEVTACEAQIENYRLGWRGAPERSFWFCGFRARAIEGTWYWGPMP